MDKTDLQQKIETAELMKQVLAQEGMQKLLALIDQLITSQQNRLVNLLDQDLEKDARLGQMLRAQIRGMKAVRNLPQHLISQGEKALNQLVSSEQ